MDVPLTTADFCYRARTLHADRVGVVDEPGVPGALGRVTYRELLRRCDGMIDALDRLGIKSGERVAVISPNAAKLLVALYAVTGSGRVLVPINFRLSAAEMQYIVDDAEASLLLVDPFLDERVASVHARHRVVMDGVGDAELFAPADDEREWPRLTEDLPATLNYTSGTTSSPKGVVLTHRSHWLNAVVVGWGFGLGRETATCTPCRSFMSTAGGCRWRCAALGVPQVIQREIRGPGILDRVGAEGITLMCGAMPVASAIVGAAADRRAAGQAVPGDGVTRMVSGGAPTPPAVIEDFERVTGWEMIHAYGLTETGPVLTVNRVLASEVKDPARRAALLARAGAPLVGVRLRADRDGQVLARTAKAMSGYWNQPELSREAFAGEWVMTGDGGELEGDGRLRITDRKKDVIVTGGENVSSLEVEACLYDHPDVTDVGVVGVPSERWGETPKALVVLRDGAVFDPDALITFCRQRLAHFKCPTSVEQRDSLPRTATGKVQKYLLREPYWVRSSERSQ